MFVVSAGVIMNIFLAAVGFMIVFLMASAFRPPVVGLVLPDSRRRATNADNGSTAPLCGRDRILMYAGSGSTTSRRSS